jgi:deferrochelatase/peroxidase EfeB
MGDGNLPDGTSAPVDVRASRGASRRRFLGATLAGAGLVVGAGGGYGVAQAVSPDSSASDVVPFYGRRQAGIATSIPQRLVFAAFDVVTRDVEQLKLTLGRWAAAASLMAEGRPIGPVEGNPAAPPVDTGEAVDLSASNLTITVGFGPSLFDDRFGLAGKRPAALAPLPQLPGDAVLDPAISGGDICVQACSDDAQVAFHAIRDFARLGRGTVVTRWSQLGFGRTAVTTRDMPTPRNLLGFRDGTNNIRAEDTAAMDEFVWVGNETDQPWMRGGSYMVTRKIRMQIEAWDSDRLGDQETIFGRRKITGAPLTGEHEFDPVDLAAKGPDGKPVIDMNAHIRLASAASNGGVRILRRGYNYTEGIDAATGQLDAGLFFICFQKNPHKQFVPLQTALGQHDLLNEYIKHISSAVFACPPGVREVGDWFGKELFSSSR